MFLIIVASSTAPSLNKLTTPTGPPSLEALSQEQTSLLQALEQLAPATITSQQLEQIKARVAYLDAIFEKIGTVNQCERKRLADAHSSLSVQVNSQEEFISRGHSLQQDLLSLTKKQKLLLECVSRQRELRTELTQVTSKPKATSQTNTVRVSTASNLTQKVLSSMASLKVSSVSSSSQPVLVQVPTKTAVKVHYKPAVVKNSVPSGKTPSSGDLSEPVPLDTLIKHGFLEPGVNILSCLILVSE